MAAKCLRSPSILRSVRMEDGLPGLVSVLMPMAIVGHVSVEVRSEFASSLASRAGESRYLSG